MQLNHEQIFHPGPILKILTKEGRTMLDIDRVPYYE